MTNQNRDRVLFEACLDLPDGEARKFLRDACADDINIEKRVLALLEAHYQASELGWADRLVGIRDRGITTQEEGEMNETGTPIQNDPLQKTFCPRCEITLGLAEVETCPKCGIDTPKGGWPVDRVLGQMVAGNQYRVLRRLGSGGFGVVYEVETAVGGLRRALKVLKEHWVENRNVRDRFINEALVLEQINHPNVARCFSAGTLEGGDLYLLFELIQGVSLAELVKRESSAGSPVEPVRAVRIAKQIAAGLAAAHSKQVLHRDLKPANILIENVGTVEERAKLLDFGVAKLVDVEMTASGEVMGTPAYLAPEQIWPDLSVGVGVDLWQLGATIHAMLTGRPPFAEPGDSLETIIKRYPKKGELGPKPSSLNPSFSSHPALDQLVSRLLATDPMDRPDSATEVCEELARIEQDLSPSLRSSRPGLLDALCAQPSANSWAALSRYLASQDADMRSQAEEKLSAWPPELRGATVSWWETTRKGDLHPLWGLVRSLDLSARGLKDRDLELLSQCPAVSSIRILNLADNEIGSSGAEALAKSPFFASLEHLELRNNRISDEGLKCLVQSPRLKRLKYIGLANNGLGPDGVTMLCSSELPLRRLDLSDNDLRAGGAEALTQSSLKQLEALNLRGNLLGPDGTALLAVSPQLTSLRDLDLSRNAVGPSGAAALAVSRNLTQIRRLVLAQNNLGRQGLQLFLTSSGLERLESLDISSNSLGPNGAMALASSQLARRLRSLDLSDNDIEDAGLASLIGAPQLTGLVSLRVAQNRLTPSGIGLFDGAPLQVELLDLSNNDLGEKGAELLKGAVGQIRVRSLEVRRVGFSGSSVATILQNGHRTLSHLDVSENDLGIEGIQGLINLPDLSSLQGLLLESTWSGSDGLKMLVSSPHLTNLRRLSLNSNGVGDDGVMEMAMRTGFTGLEELSLSDNGITASGAAALATSALTARIRRLDLSYNRLGDAGAEALAYGSGWPQLQQLNLRTNSIGLSGVAALLASTGLEMLQSLDLFDNPLEGELDIRGLGQDKIALMESTFNLLSANSAQFTDRFYEKLFRGFPGVKPLFKNASMGRQKQHLFASLVLVIDNLRKPDSVEGALRELGKRHVGYGVSPSHYYAVSSTLLDVIRETLADEWTEEAYEAWSDGLEAICRIMMDAHRSSRKGNSAEPGSDQ